MHDDFFPVRLAQLRQSKGVSARDMSLSIGQNKNYINHVENRKMLPSMQVFFYICEYLGITPKDFFDEGNTEPELISELVTNAKKLDKKALMHISGIITELIEKG